MDEGGQKETRDSISRPGWPGFLRCAAVEDGGALNAWADSPVLPNLRIRLVLSRPLTAKSCTARTAVPPRLPGPVAACCVLYKRTQCPMVLEARRLLCAAVMSPAVRCDLVWSGRRCQPPGKLRRLNAQTQAECPRAILGLLTGSPWGCDWREGSVDHCTCTLDSGGTACVQCQKPSICWGAVTSHPARYMYLCCRIN
jgi:hypothetical protein